MESEVINAGEWRVVKLGGDIDMHASPTARGAILQSIREDHPVVVDLSAVTYIDSSGIASLVEAIQKAKKAGTGFALAAPNPAALRVLELARLDRVFRIFPSLEEGLDAGG